MLNGTLRWGGGDYELVAFLPAAASGAGLAVARVGKVSGEGSGLLGGNAFEEKIICVAGLSASLCRLGLRGYAAGCFGREARCQEEREF